MKIALAGTTANTAQCAQALIKADGFEISWILTPAPKPIGRKKTITPNPLHQFAEKNNIPAVLVDKKIDQEIKNQIEAKVKKSGQPDILLVVDFGYIVPQWLLDIPKIAPVNIHPSILPAWRGSSPGQFVLLTGAKQSAVSMIVMNDKLDEGDIIHQEYFQIEDHWTQSEYYQTSFKLISLVLAEILERFAKGEIKAKVQPKESPTPIAVRFSKQNALIDWIDLEKLMTGKTIEVKEAGQKLSKNGNLLSLLKYAIPKLEAVSAAHIISATRALQPWPVLWTLIPTTKGDKRMKIYSCSADNSTGQAILKLETVQIEGQQKAEWNQVKNIVES